MTFNAKTFSRHSRAFLGISDITNEREPEAFMNNFQKHPPEVFCKKRCSRPAALLQNSTGVFL